MILSWKVTFERLPGPTQLPSASEFLIDTRELLDQRLLDRRAARGRTRLAEDGVTAPARSAGIGLLSHSIRRASGAGPRWASATLGMTDTSPTMGMTWTKVRIAVLISNQREGGGRCTCSQLVINVGLVCNAALRICVNTSSVGGL